LASQSTGSSTEKPHAKNLATQPTLSRGLRTSELELLAKEQEDCLREIENSVKDALTATKAVAQRVGTIFWMAIAGCTLGVFALFLSALLFFRH
jgi:hypothetical protein